MSKLLKHWHAWNVWKPVSQNSRASSPKLICYKLSPTGPYAQQDGGIGTAWRASDRQVKHDKLSISKYYTNTGQKHDFTHFVYSTMHIVNQPSLSWATDRNADGVMALFYINMAKYGYFFFYISHSLGKPTDATKPVSKSW